MNTTAKSSIISLGSTTRPGGSEAPDFLNQKVLVPKSTTDLDTNPVLSDISLPATFELSQREQHAEIHDENDHLRKRVGNLSSHASAVNPARLPIGISVERTKHDSSLESQHKAHAAESVCDSPDSAELSFEDGVFPSRVHPIPLESNARTKRSSIYQGRPSGTMPTRGFSRTSHSTFLEGDDRKSVKSMSSSLTASFSKSFLFGFYHTYKNGAKPSKSVLSREYWMKDESARECFACAKSFTTFRRKHHCRICGQIFCGNCCFLIDGGKYQHAGKVRVCRNCHTHFDHLDDSSDESSVDENEQATQVTTSNSPDKRVPNSDVLLLKDDEVQSILTTGDGTNLFRSTPPPLPKMAIPATRQGGSVEISIPNMTSPYKIEGPSRYRPSLKDRFTIRDVDLLQPYDKDETGSTLGSNRQYQPEGQASFPHILNLKHSISNYITNTTVGDEQKATLHSSNSVIENLSRNDFKFEFNYGMGNFQGFLNSAHSQSLQIIERKPSKRTESSPVLASYNEGPHFESETKHSDDGSEDERSMSLYAALNDSHQESHSVRPTRSNTKSLQRAQASLQRMNSRRKSRGRALLNPSLKLKPFEFLTHSSPNLKSVIDKDDDHDKLSESLASVDRSKPRSEASSSTRDMKRIISTASVLRLKSQESKTELNEVSQIHMNALLKQVLSDQDVANVSDWIDMFKPILQSLQSIRLDARKMNGLDFKQHYVKIKRIDGGDISDSKFMNGIVYSKNLPLKTMPRFVKSPRILLVMFPLEYQKNETHFMSIDSVMAQEREYLKKLVSRLTALNPDLILVGANVSGYALELLNDSGVAIQFNMKPQVIERVSKLTEASIAITVDKLATNIKLGSCGSFEIKTYRYGNIVKSYTFLDDCKLSEGGTILLRGSNSVILRKIKDITEFMVYAVFSLKLESSFFSDNFLQLSVDYYERIAENRQIASQPSYFTDFIDKFHQRILSVSPTVEYPIPFLLEKARALERELVEKEEEGELLLKNPAFHSGYMSKSLKYLGLEPALTNRDLKQLVRFMHEKDIEDLKARFKWRSRQWELSYALSKNMLGTGTHQTINVLYSMISKKTATPCVGPQMVSIDFFWDTDISIGQFIENIVQMANYPCAHGCGSLLLDHYRSYVHGTGKVDVLVEQFQSRLPSLKNVLLTWSYCKRCNSSTPILQMSEKTWNYSFGKYLELMFWSRNKGIKTIGNCCHDFAKDHVKYFSLNDWMVRMEYSDIEVHELITPRSQVTWKPNIDIKLKVELYYQILDKINNFYASVNDRLERIKLDSIPSERVSAGEKKISELKVEADKEKELLTELTDSIYRNTPGNQHLPLNAIIRSVHDNAAGWDLEFIEFEKTYLPSERDVARITAVQLKKLFTDSVKNEQEHRSLARSSFDTEEEFDSSLPRDQRFTGGRLNSSLSNDLELLKAFGTSKFEKSGELGRSPSKKQPIVRPRPLMVHHRTAPTINKSLSRGPQSVSKDDIFVDGAEVGNNLGLDYTRVRKPSSGASSTGVSDVAPQSTSYLSSHSLGSIKSGSTLNIKDQTSESKVGQLANFFDRIHFDALSREFELQREFERLQLNKNKYKAVRVESSKPIVEIYKNVKDAVNEPLHTDSQKVRHPFNKQLHHDWKDSGKNAEDISNPSKELGNKLEHSIHQWGEQILRGDEDPPSGGGTRAGGESEKTGSDFNLEAAQAMAESKTQDSSTTSQPERSSLMKMLANFWADRSATLWKSLDYPTISTEHIFVDSLVIIREDEPSSLIAFCLSSNDYLQKMSAPISNKGVGIDSRSVVSQKDECDANSLPSSLAEDEHSTLGDHERFKKGDLNNNAKGTQRQRPPSVGSTNPQKISDAKVMVESEKRSLEQIMTKKTAMHLRYQFQDGNSIMSCKIFFAEQFDAFRKTCGCEESFIQSLSRCVKWDSSGGKSGSAFLKTLDDRFVIKELSHTELDSFIKFAPSYFEYMAQAMFHDLPTALAKVFGFYQIQTKNSESGKSFKIDVLIMENLFYNKKTSRIFDLKGSMRNRHVKQTGKENEVLLDENMVEYIYESPIFVREYDKKLLRASLWNDTLFLAKMNVMDYSLVVGVDNTDHTLTVGIIDFIRTFTWDKKLESWVKERGFVGGSTKEPTVVTPRQYKNRFRVAMERYILMVPDPWFQDSHN
ncbi:LAME_0E10572g1_1 [Lachancea meyersii CBS 8951]|uniref:1-phosphatidylinositol-3-phosphate 5-kinase n=1 Tax=Lachancea meyersii CBS 8951 TaxID=1266667 RepID=A0A1G4JKB5_9SACH|nr:LAME_0E10572g1_1 [Lachancea meyersii CBS 8951]